MHYYYLVLFNSFVYSSPINTEVLNLEMAMGIWDVDYAVHASLILCLISHIAMGPARDACLHA